MGFRMPAATLEARMTETNNRSSGFDYLRLGLSLAVILWHSYVLSYGSIAAHQLSPFFLVPVRTILISFFVLSGFLVAGSLWRCQTLFSFLGLRVIRIVPALFLEVTISALLLGPVVTTLPLAEYFSSREFHTYFLNIVGAIHYTLPGVFLSNPFPQTVNGQLWTIPWELECYISLAILSAVGIVKHRFGFAAALLAIQLYFIYQGMQLPDSAADFVPGKILVMGFLYGVGFNVYRAVIPYSRGLLVAALVAAIFLLQLQKGALFAALPLAYITIYLGLCNPTKGKFIKSGDYSYGLYLYGFPMQQLVAQLSGNNQNWLKNYLCATAISFVIAYFSWNYVELPSSKLRSKLLKMEAVYIKWRFQMRKVFLTRQSNIDPE